MAQTVSPIARVTEVATTATMRIPALVAQATAVSMLATVVFRAAKLVASSVGSGLYRLSTELYTSNAPNALQTGVLAFGEKTYFFEFLGTLKMFDNIPTSVLLTRSIAVCFWSTLMLEVAFYACGKPSPVYNQVLSVTRISIKDTSFIRDAREFAYDKGWLNRPAAKTDQG